MASLKNSSLTLGISLAVVLYIFLNLIEGFISLPLREASSFLSYLMLKLTGILIELNGTILSTSRMSFDVVPACSGSTTLKVMIFSGVIWGTLQTRLSKRQRSLIALSTIPISLAVNALRLTTLVIIGHYSFKPVTGILHEVTGIFAFLIAFGIMVWLTKNLTSTQETSPSTIKYEKNIFLTIILTLYYFPTLSWIYNSWISSPLDKLSCLFIIYATALLIIHFRKQTNSSPSSSKVLISLLMMFLIIEATAHLADINILRALNLIFFISLIIYGRYGHRQLYSCIPLLLISVLGLPTTSFIINKSLTFLIATNISTALYLKIALCLFFTWYWHKIKLDSQHQPQTNPHAFKLLIAPLTICLLTSISQSESKQKTNISSSIDLSYLLGDWIGKNTNFSNDTPNLWSRVYRKNSQQVEVIISASAGDRHDLHPPEYCLTGAGWLLSDEKTIHWQADQKTIPITKMVLSKNNQKKFFFHWYSDGKSYYKSFQDMLAEDSLRRLKGDTTNWFLVRIISDNSQTITDDFLHDFKGSFQSSEKVFDF